MFRRFVKAKTGTLAYQLYSALHTCITISGLIGPARRLAGPTIGRLLYRLSAGYSGPVDIRGHRMSLASRGTYPPADMAMGRYEPRTTQLFEEIVKPGMVVVDVGAHVGYYSLLAARHVGDTGIVYSFEPEPQNYAQLVNNISLNGYNNVRPVNYGLGRTTGPSVLYLTSLDNGRHSIYRVKTGIQSEIAIETTTLDIFLESEQWPHVDVIKIDVEGAEADVLNGMKKSLLRSSDLQIIIEFNPVLIHSSKRDPKVFLNDLIAMNFKVFGIDEKNGLVPLEEVRSDRIYERLIETESSVNLYCTRA